MVSFNDDIQGTGATALAGLMAACRLSGVSFAEQRVVIVGGGAAGKGIARQIKSSLADAGVGGSELEMAVAVTDSRGLIAADRDRLDDYKRELAWGPEALAKAGVGEDRSLGALIAALRPTVLIGTSGQRGLFSEAMVREMAEHVERPIVFPFSNPTDHAEARPEDLLEWSGGRALIATGSPFEPVEIQGRRVHFGQGNNALIFPGVGLGALVSDAARVTDSMFSAAAGALAQCVSEEEMARGQVYPSVARLREVTHSVAVAVADAAVEAGVGRLQGDRPISQVVRAQMWEPIYPKLVPV